MPGLLLHSPADILRRVIIALGYGSDPDPTQTVSWPVYAHVEPDRPDSCITVYDVQGTDQGRTMPDGERSTMDGVQVRFRAPTFHEIYVKANALMIGLDQLFKREIALDGTTYLVWHFMRSSGPIPLGRDGTPSQRQIATLNGTMRVSKLPLSS